MAEFLLSIQEALDSVPVSHKTGVVAQACNPSTGEVGAGGSEILPHGKFWASLASLRPCLNKTHTVKWGKQLKTTPPLRTQWVHFTGTLGGHRQGTGPQPPGKAVLESSFISRQAGGCCRGSLWAQKISDSLSSSHYSAAAPNLATWEAGLLRLGYSKASPVSSPLEIQCVRESP